jgi:hypothetical protein
MRQGVYDADVFILFLTNSVLSRPFCLMEIGCVFGPMPATDQPQLANAHTALAWFAARVTRVPWYRVLVHVALTVTL